MVIGVNTFYWIKPRDLDYPIVCYHIYKSGDIFTLSLDIEGHREMFAIGKVVEETDKFIKVNTDNHGLVEIRLVGEKEFNQLKKTEPVFQDRSWNQIKDKRPLEVLK